MVIIVENHRVSDLLQHSRKVICDQKSAATRKKNKGGDEVRLVNNSDHDSNSCLEYSSFEGSSDDDNIELEYFLGKDKATKHH